MTVIIDFSHRSNNSSMVDNTEFAIKISNKDSSNFTISSNDLVGLTSTRLYAFCGCNLTSVNLPSVVTVGSNTFLNCKLLTYADLQSATTISGSAFQGCSALSSVNLPSVTTLAGNAFNNCTSLSSISLPLVKSLLTNTFSYCTSLASVDLSGLEYTSGSNSFGNCTNLTSLNFPSIKSIGASLFNSTVLSKLKTITIGNAVTSLNSYSFRYQTAITSIIIAKPAGSITGAPWGATNATVTWTG